MKVQFVLPLTLLTSVILVGFMKIRKKEHDTEEKRSRFQDIKMRVTSDVLQEYHNEKAEKHNELEKAQSALKTMEDEMKVVQTKAEKSTQDLAECQDSQKSGTDQMVAAETNQKNLKAETEKETAEWKAELDRLKKQMTEKSPVCNFLKETPDPIKTMCGIKEEAKPEPPKKEEAKPEAPKKEEAKPEAPKQEEAKPEAPKQEEAKPEAPKQEEAKPEAPKQEEAKPEAPSKRRQSLRPPSKRRQSLRPPNKRRQSLRPPNKRRQRQRAPNHR